MTNHTTTKVGQLSQLAALAVLLAGCRADVPTFSIVHDLMSGFPAAPSGTAIFYLPNTTTPIAIYGDSTGTAISNPVTLDVNGSAQVWLSQLARMIVQTNGGVTVSDSVVNQAGDTALANSSPAFTGTTQKAVNDAALAAFGGVDFTYVPSGSWVGMSPKAWMNGVLRNVLAYGSVGATTVNDGVTPADSALAAAIADAQAAGATEVFLPAGTYLLNSACAISNTGVSIRGAGAGVTTVKINGATNNGFTVTSANGTRFRGLRITGTTTGKSISVSGTSGLILEDVKTDGAAIGVYLSNTNNISIYGNCSIDGTIGLAGTTVLRMSAVSGAITSIDTTSGAGFSDASFLGVQIGGFTTDANSGRISVIGCAVSFVFTGGAEPTRFYQYANGIDGYKIGILSGATGTPDRSLGNIVKFDGTTTGSAYIIAAPTPTPATRGARLQIQFYNHAGGAVTGWTLNATYKVNTTIPTTDAHVISVTFEWDLDASVWREVSRADTPV